MASDGEETKLFSLAEVGQHVAQDDCWLVINGKVKGAALVAMLLFAGFPWMLARRSGMVTIVGLAMLLGFVLPMLMTILWQVYN